VTVHGAGRTDAGVHAEGQVASFRLTRTISAQDLRDAINGNLDPDVRVIECEAVDENFHARISARGKVYRYRIWTGPVVSPFLRRYVHHFRGELDIDEMKIAAASLVGRHDFSAFTIADNDAEDRTRNLRRLDVDFVNDEVRITAEADGFLRFMVRTLAGTLIDVGRARIAGVDVARILSSRNRSNAGATAPAAGLTLMRVDY